MNLILFDAVSKSRVKRFQAFIRRLPGLVAYYPLNESSGDAINRSSTGISLNGAATAVTRNVSGLIGKASSFDGSTSFIDITIQNAMQTAIRANTPITISFFLATTVATNKRFFGGSDSGNSDMLIIDLNRNDSDSTTTQNKIRGFIRSTDNKFDNWGITNAYTGLTDGNFHLINFVIKPGSPRDFKIYIDGISQEVTVNNFGGDFTNFDLATSLYLGASNSEGSLSGGLECSMQHIFINNQELSATNILNLARLATLA